MKEKKGGILKRCPDNAVILWKSYHSTGCQPAHGHGPGNKVMNFQLIGFGYIINQTYSLLAYSSKKSAPLRGPSLELTLQLKLIYNLLNETKDISWIFIE